MYGRHFITIHKNRLYLTVNQCFKLRPDSFNLKYSGRPAIKSLLGLCRLTFKRKHDENKKKYDQKNCCYAISGFFTNRVTELRS